MSQQKIRPFLKWAGRKYRVFEHIQKLLPDGKRFIEPFAGSAAVFLNSHYKKNILGDSNQDLINVFQSIHDQCDEFITEAKLFFTPKNNQKERYYALRDKFNNCKEPWERAKLFLYLNRHAYNGLCRYNSSGGFNVPFGRYIKPYFPEPEIRLFRLKAKHAQFICDDYKAIMKKAKSGDVIYCDPPYVPLSDSAYFTRYATNDFTMDDQLELAQLAKKMAARGITVLISNHDIDFTRDAYQGAHIESFKVARYISCQSAKREPVKELVAVFRAD